jgi:hypothetical protein
LRGAKKETPAPVSISGPLGSWTRTLVVDSGLGRVIFVDKFEEFSFGFLQIR